MSVLRRLLRYLVTDMPGKRSQSKGRTAELELVKILNDHGIPAEPGKAVSFGETPDITGIQGIHAEVKRVERLNINTAMDQAVRDADRFCDGSPAVFHRQNRTQWKVTMLLTDWIRLYRKAIYGRDTS